MGSHLCKKWNFNHNGAENQSTILLFMKRKVQITLFVNREQTQWYTFQVTDSNKSVPDVSPQDEPFAAVCTGGLVGTQLASDLDLWKIEGSVASESAMDSFEVAEI